VNYTLVTLTKLKISDNNLLGLVQSTTSKQCAHTDPYLLTITLLLRN